MSTAEERYARAADGTYIAYQVVGDGPIDIAWAPDLWSVDALWQVPKYAAWFRALGSFSRLILHDRRATGGSSRNVDVPNIETRMSDLRTVLDEVGAELPVLGGQLEGGAVNVLFAATMPERVRSLFWWYPAPRSIEAPDYPWGGSQGELERWLQDIIEAWGTRTYNDPSEPTIDWGVLSRQSATPDVAVQHELVWRQTDVRATLPSVQASTLLLARENDREALEYLVAMMPRATMRLFPNSGDSIPAIHEQAEVLRAIRGFIGVQAPAPELDTVLATVLFTDIVNSTERQSSLGDTGWKELVGHHHVIVRDALVRWRGVENDTAGDGFFATFDGPARAIRCAQEVVQRVQDLGIEVRAGVHTGECTVIDGKVGGLGVVIGSRIADTAGPSEILVSQTVKDLTAGSGLTFEEIGACELKGIPERWHLHRVAA
ncbi:MAG TPA: adenylate/guanylate cyclase domain-containing protein [Actinomycetota bacterium]|nr:adenylate/guanylate cyclase domain-containing protein [Actinomycetota bacterium]